MERRIWGPALAASAVLVIGYALVPGQVAEEVPETPVEQAREALIQRIDRPKPAPHEHRAVRPMSRPKPGIDREVVAHHPPLNDPEAWQNQRAAAAEQLHHQQVAATWDFAEQQELSPADAEEIAAAIDALHSQLRALKAGVELGEIRPDELREESPLLREEAETRIAEAAGVPQMEALRSALAGTLGGGF